MKYKPLIIVMGEPYSIFLEILFKAFKSSFISKVKRPIILIGSAELLQKQTSHNYPNFCEEQTSFLAQTLAK